MQETRVLSLGQEDPLEEEMATHSSILAWEIPWTQEPGGIASRESHRSLDIRERKRETAATAREESARACPHSRGGLTPLGGKRMQNSLMRDYYLQLISIFFMKSR